MLNKPVLSIGMIVKNEIRCLEKCLKALQPLRDAIPCELVIADTGSTDGTREIAGKYADVLFDFEWINDFSAARNAVIRRCSGKWHMFVDADEYLVPELDELLAFLKSPLADTVNFATYVVRNQFDSENNVFYNDYQLTRMARMHPGLRFEGAIHEQFVVCATDQRIDLRKTVFHHDGYAAVTPDHRKKKRERNLALLEPLLERDPHNLKVMLQCVESSNLVGSESGPYIRRAMKEIMGGDCTADRYSVFAPAIVKESLFYALHYLSSALEEWYCWGAEKFPESYYIKIDGNYFYLCHLYANRRYQEMFAVGDAYFDAVNDYLNHGMLHDQCPVSSILTADPMRIHIAHSMLAEAYCAVGKNEKMIEHMGMMNLQQTNNEALSRWFKLFEKNVDLPMARETIVRKLTPFYEKRASGSDEDKQLWEKLLVYLKRSFAIERGNASKLCQLYIDFPGEIGISARLINAQSVEEGQNLLDRIEDWSMVMPLALQNAMKLGLVFPDAFYRVLPERLHSWENTLIQNDSEAVDYVLYYTKPEQIADWHRLCFAFDFLCAVCMHKESFVGEYADALSDRFAQVGALFLQEYYNPHVIANEDAIDRLPALHRFTWYYVRAVELRLEDDWVGYVKNLRTALKEAEAMRDFVNYLLDDVQARRKREQIANASPELIALAGQVKAILATYPADDPAVAALKTTLAYQQVAFLVEE